MSAVAPGPLEGAVAQAVAALRDGLGDLGPRVRVESLGRVTRSGDGIVDVAGFSDLMVGELLDVAGLPAIAEEVSRTHGRLVLLGHSDAVDAGATVRRGAGVLTVPAGTALLGRVVDPLGRPIDGRGPLPSHHRIRVDGDVVALRDREQVTRPLRTGILGIDAMVPVGLGQRELIVGDRATGKSELGLGVLAGLDPDVIGIYVAIAARGAETAGHVAWLRARGFLEHGFVVASDADAPTGVIHLAPYSACAMAESLAHAGRDVVIVYDDLTRHAHAHRSLALLLGRPVGREAHPVDVFHAHARLLERAGQFGPRQGNGSLTALPIVETQGGDLTGYIPTNLVSITDGQIRLDAGLVAAGLEPPIDVGLSVSRVGGKAQPALLRAMVGSFKNRYAQFLELETFARFGSQLEPASQAVIDWGRRVRVLLTQPRERALSWSGSIARLLIAELPEFTTLPLARVGPIVDDVLERLWASRPHLRSAIDELRADRSEVAALRPVIAELMRQPATPVEAAR